MFAGLTERLHVAPDILSVTLPDFTVSKTPHRQEKWPTEAAELSRIYGSGDAGSSTKTVLLSGLSTLLTVVLSCCF